MITIDNYEQYFFQYQEGLLDEAARREVETFAKQHPELGEELSLYADSPRLTAYAMTMPNKETLKHKVSFPWWRYVAAVAIIAVLAMGGWHLRPTSEESLWAEAERPVDEVCKKDNTNSPAQYVIPDTKFPKPHQAMGASADEVEITCRAVGEPAEPCPSYAEAKEIARCADQSLSDIQKDLPVSELNSAFRKPSADPSLAKEKSLTDQDTHPILLADEVEYVDFLADETHTMPDNVKPEPFPLGQLLARVFQRNRENWKALGEELFVQIETK